MPGSENPDDLLPDYLVECEEHLTAAGRALLSIEPDPTRHDRGQLDALFRNFHTVKGLSGMVGLREAEHLAHALENYLGAVRRGAVGLSAGGVAALLDGVKALEEVIAARAEGLAVPPVEPLVGRVAALLPADEAVVAPTPPPPDPVARADAAARAGAAVWRVRFAPTPELSARGLTVNAVRDRLRAAGEIVHAEPTVVPGGVSFTFLVVARGDDFATAVGDDGLTLERYEPVAAAPRTVSLTPANLVRVDLGRLDELMRTVGELVITRARLENGLGRAAAALPPAEWHELRETSRVMERQLRDLREGVMRVRLVPVRDVFARMRFVVRDLAREAGREVELHLTGEATEIDKYVVERLADPLLHLIRNAVGHGLEAPAERVAAGKPACGRIDLRAAAAGGAVVVEVEDDGRGIDPAAVFARARAAGLVPADAPADPAGVLELLCAPGFSTRDGADRVSGRGVGMDVVASAVEALAGTLALDTRPGRGTRFTARLPVTLAITDALVVTAGGQTYAVPQVAVREVAAVEPAAVTVMENNELLAHRGGVLPLIRLAGVFGSGRTDGPAVALVVGDAAPVALAVDRVLGVHEVVVRPLVDPLVQVPGVAGATELGDGRAVLILDAVGLARLARTRRRPAGPPGERP